MLTQLILHKHLKNELLDLQNVSFRVFEFQITKTIS